jgi:type I restriction enzyme, S subunit
MIDEFPEGWAECCIGDIAHVVGGGTPDARDLTNFSTKAGIPWLTPADLSGYKEIYVSRGKRFLTKKGFEHSSAKLMPKGAVLFSSRAPIGYVAVAGNEICTNQGFRSFVCADSVSPEYLYFWLKYAKPLAEELASGTTFAEISGTNAAKIPLLLAPVAEQQRIAAKLKKLLDQVDVCQKRLAKIPTLLKRFRQSVLASACSGRLTADWREENLSIESAETLFTKIKAERQRRYENECRQAVAAGRRKPKHPDSNELSRNTVNDLPEIPKAWAYFRMEELCHQVTDGTHKTPKYQTSGVPFLSVKNVRPFLVRDADIKFISEEEHRSINSRCNPEKGDILYTKIGATFGYAAVNGLDYAFSIFVSLALLKPVTPFFVSAFAELVMNSEIVFSQARERVTGIGTPDLHLVEIRDFRVPLPPQLEQQEIVRRVQSLFVLADRIEARFADGRKRVDSITQAILAKAFRGELVPTEAELAEAEGRSFESAEELLEKLRRNPLVQTPSGRNGTPRSKAKA